MVVFNKVFKIQFAFYITTIWRRRRDLPASLLRSAARTRAPKQSPGLFLCFALPFSNLALYKKQVHKSAPVFLWRRRRDLPASLLRSAARTRAPKQSPGLFLCFALPFSNLALYKKQVHKSAPVFLWRRRRDSNSRGIAP